MSASRIAVISAKFAAVAGAILIGVIAPAIGATHSVADDGGTSQTSPPPPDGNPWGD